MNIIEDDRIAAAEKPAGRLVIPGRDDEEETVHAELERRLGRKLWIVHRIDKDTSGLVIFAKDSKTHQALSLLFEERKIQKTYLAAVSGRLESDGTVETPLRTFGSGRVGPDPKGKPSSTAYSVRERFADASLLEVRPKTGRKHQIRAHLNSIDHPILGDRRYGSKRPVGGMGRLMLHAWKLEFEGRGLPKTALEARIPDDFLAILDELR